MVGAAYGKDHKHISGVTVHRPYLFLYREITIFVRSCEVVYSSKTYAFWREQMRDILTGK